MNSVFSLSARLRTCYKPCSQSRGRVLCELGTVRHPRRFTTFRLAQTIQRRARDRTRPEVVHNHSTHTDFPPVGVWRRETSRPWKLSGTATLKAFSSVFGALWLTICIAFFICAASTHILYLRNFSLSMPQTQRLSYFVLLTAIRRAIFHVATRLVPRRAQGAYGDAFSRRQLSSRGTQ